MNWQSRIESALQQRHRMNQWRQRQTFQGPQRAQLILNGQPLLNFCSNDYLGLAETGADDLQRAAQQWGLGSGASHLVCGHSQAHHDLECALAHHTGYPRALLFSTGYMANLGCLQALTQKGDLILEDKLNHASLIDGAVLSRADFQRYHHGDYTHLEQRLLTHRERSHKATDSNGLSLVVSDSIFSMDGDLADLSQLASLCQHHESQLMVDDAHGFGVIGEQGAGARSAFNLTQDELPVYVGTLGKALGGFGAFVAGSDELIDYLIQFARPYIYTTALPPAVADAMLGNLSRLQDGQRQGQLNQHIQYFRTQADKLGIPVMASQSPIQPIMIGTESEALRISRMLRERGLLVTAIRPPTVPAGTSRLRITLTAAHSIDHIDQLLSALDELIPHKSGTGKHAHRPDLSGAEA